MFLFDYMDMFVQRKTSYEIFWYQVKRFYWETAYLQFFVLMFIGLWCIVQLWKLSKRVYGFLSSKVWSSLRERINRYGAMSSHVATVGEVKTPAKSVLRTQSKAKENIDSVETKRHLEQTNGFENLDLSTPSFGSLRNSTINVDVTPSSTKDRKRVEKKNENVMDSRSVSFNFDVDSRDGDQDTFQEGFISSKDSVGNVNRNLFGTRSQ